MVESNTKLGQSGGIIIPTEYRRKTSLEAGDEVIMHLDEDGLHLYTPAQAIGEGASTGAALHPGPGGTKPV
jgi:bifunctional DNA-binding transcriptional regulator/antitoxin component of YhaV-PrlF toxin-antitoxin module